MSSFDDDMTSDEFDAEYETGTPVDFIPSTVRVLVEQTRTVTPGGGIWFNGTGSFAANNVVREDVGQLSPPPSPLGTLAGVGTVGPTMAGASAA